MLIYMNISVIYMEWEEILGVGRDSRSAKRFFLTSRASHLCRYRTRFDPIGFEEQSEVL